MSRCETICASVGVSFSVGRKNWLRRKAGCSWFEGDWQGPAI
jgi:hypothetical protein